MPIYVFTCPRCENKYEELKKAGDYKQICPYCEKENEIVEMKPHTDSWKHTPPPFGIYCQQRINRKD